MSLHKTLVSIFFALFVCFSCLYAEETDQPYHEFDIIKNYSGQNFRSKNIRYSHFDEFFEDYKGRIWGCSVSGEITLWDGIDFVEIAKVPGRTFGLYQYDEKTMMIGTNGGIVLFNTETYEIVPVSTEIKNVRGLVESNGYLYAIGEDCIQKSSIENPAFSVALNLNTSRIIDSAVTPDGSVYILSHYHGIYRYDTKTNQLENLNLRGINQSKEVNLKMDIHNDSIWIGTDKNAYCSPLRKGALLTPIKEFEGITVKCIDHASDGCLLVGTDNGFFVKRDGQWTQYRNYNNSMLSLLNDCVWGFFEDSRHNIWIGVEAGVSLYSALHEYISVDWSFGSSIQGNRISCILRDSKDRIWVGGINGLSMFDAQTNNTIIFDKNSRNSCIDKRIWKVVEDSSGTIWICTDKSIGMYDEKNETFIARTVVDSETGNDSKWAYDLLDSDDGYLWLATGSAGFLRVSKDLLMGKEEIVIADLAINSRNNRYKVLSDVGFRLSRSGNNIWGAFPDGIYNLSEIANKESDNRENKPDYDVKGAMQIACDHLSNIWSIAGNTLTCSDVKSGEIKSYDINQIGIPGILLGFAKSGTQILVLSSQCLALFDPQVENVIPLLEQQKSSYRTVYYDDHTGSIYLGGADKFIIIVQARLIDNLKNYERTSYISKHELNNNNLTVSFSNNRIEESTPPYSGYYYRLKGYDDNWIPVNKGMSIDYKMLPPNDYSLQLGKRFGMNDPMEMVDEISVDVPYPWYTSVWFYALLLLLIILAASGYIRQYSLGLQLKLAKADKELLLSQYASTKAATLDAVARKAEELNKITSARQAMIERANKRWLDELQKQVENHLSDTDFNVSALAEISGMNEKTLYRKIKALTGKTTIEYIKTLRMERAAALLLSEGNLAINEVMYMSGFVSPSYFSRCFEETFHMKPSEYRLKHQGLQENQKAPI